METYPSLIAYLEDAALPHRITSTTGGTHAPGSYHYTGNAIDAAEPWPSYDTPGLAAIQHAWLPVADQLAELIGPDPNACFKNGAPHWYPASTMAAHQDHVHVASTVNVTHPDPAGPDPKERAMAYVALVTHPDWDGYLEVQEDGGVFGFGDAPFYGSVPGLGIELHGPARILDAKATASGAGYWLMGGDGAVYSFGDAPYRGGRNQPAG